MRMHSRCVIAGLMTLPAAAVSLALLRPKPVALGVTRRAGDDTVIINQMRPTRLSMWVLDQYGRRVASDSGVRYAHVAGDPMTVSEDGKVRCDSRRDAVVRATFGRLSRDFVLRCRPVAWIEAATWLDMMVGDSTRDLSFVAHGPDGRAVTELRGSVIIHNKSIVAAEGTRIRAEQSGMTVAEIAIGNAEARIPIMIYQQVTSFLDNPRRVPLMAMPVSLARGDTIETPLPKAAFWVTYFSRDPSAPPPTIELKGDGSCAQGDGVRQRRIEDGEYAKYCLTGTGARMMIAHGAGGAERVTGVVAIRLM